MGVVIIFNHCISDSGLGDTIRSLFSYFILSRKIGFKIYYDFSGQNLGHCFLANTDHKCTKDCKFFKDFSKGPIKTHEFINFLTIVSKYPKESHLFHVRSNHCFDVVPYKDLHKKENTEAFMKWLKLTPELEARIKHFTPKGKEGTPLKYTALHIRCGDKFMQNGPCVGDSRLNPMDKSINLLVENLTTKEKIILFTDNDELKNKYRKYCLDTKAIHIGQKAVPTSVIDTVSEFFLVGMATRIVAPIRSGFSYWPSVLFGKRITSV